jgi:hypothetical protein
MAAAVAPSSPSPETHATGRGNSVTLDTSDDDDFDMEIERNTAMTSLPGATSAHAHGAHAPGAPPSSAHRPGLELAAPSRMARERSTARYAASEPGIGTKLAGVALGTVIAGATAVALRKYMHHTGGYDVTRALPHAFDGSSAPESGALSLFALVLAVALGFLGLKVRPHAWGIIGAGGAMMLLALAMVTVTLASTGENPTPPDGALLVPYLFPAALLLGSLGIVGRAARRFAVGRGARRAGSIPVAAIAGLVAFLAFETSRFAR